MKDVYRNATLTLKRKKNEVFKDTINLRIPCYHVVFYCRLAAPQAGLNDFAVLSLFSYNPCTSNLSNAMLATGQR